MTNGKSKAAGTEFKEFAVKHASQYTKFQFGYTDRNDEKYKKLLEALKIDRDFKDFVLFIDNLSKMRIVELQKGLEDYALTIDNI